jgi:polysaccharide pyruvyl transferase WcaK-like protein
VGAGTSNLPATAAPPLRIGLLGMFTSRNLGDAAIVREIVRNLRLRRPDCELVAISREPEDSVRLLGTAAFPADGYGPALHADGQSWNELAHPRPRWLDAGLGTRRIAALVRTLDLLVMAGGGQIEDFFGGVRSQPRILLTWSALARFFGIPVAYFSVGVDQVLQRRSRFLLVNALHLAHFRSLRDAGSVEWLRQSGFRGEARVDPDAALSIDVRCISPAREPPTNDRIIVSPVSYRTWSTSRNKSYERYLESLASACDRWIGAGRRVSIVCSNTTMDPPIAEEVVARMSVAARSHCDIEIPATAEEFVTSVRDARCVIASRLHGLILAVAAGTPVIGVSPARKVTRFMRDCGFSELCVEIPDLNAEKLCAMVEQVTAGHAELSRRVAEIAADSRAQLEGAYDDLIRLLTSNSTLKDDSPSPS